MTGSELESLLRRSDMSLSEISNRLDVEPDRIQHLISLGNNRLPLPFLARLREVFDQVS